MMRGAGERGAALPLAMVCLVALTVMILTFLTLSGVEPQISQNLADTARARYLAESGIEWAFRQVAAAPGGPHGGFAPALFAGLDHVPNTADDQQPTGVAGQSTAAMLTPLGSPSALPTKTAADGTYTVTVRNDNLAGDAAFAGGGAAETGDKFRDENGIVIVTSTGVYRSARRTIQVAIKRIAIPPFPGALNIAGDRAGLVLASGINAGNASRLDIDGRDHDRDGTPNTANPPKLGIQVRPGGPSGADVSHEARVEQPFDDGTICTDGDCGTVTRAANRSARLGIVKGRDQSSGADTTGLGAIAPDDSLNPAVMARFLSEVAASPATQILRSTPACPLLMTGGSGATTRTPGLTNGCGMNATVDLGTTSDPKVTYLRGDPDAPLPFAALTMNRMIQGAGLLVVEDGDLEQLGHLRWDGIVVVTGRHVAAAFRTGSRTTIYGALTGMTTDPGEAAAGFDVVMEDDIDLQVRASKQNLDMVQQMLALHRMFGWREG